MTALLASLFDSAIVLTLALVATALARRRSAALRHTILATAIVTAALMPAFEALLPLVTVVRWPTVAAVASSGALLTSNASTASTTGEMVAAARDGVPWAVALGIVWLLGTTVTGAGLLTGLVRLARLERRSAPAAGRWRELTDELSGECGVERRVALLQSDDPSLLVTCGIASSSIILPAGASDWADDRIRVVLRHELAHVTRRDAVVQIAAELFRIMQWPNPLVWIACRRLRQESEYACDDAVLGGGVEATDYATHLVEVARQLSGRRSAWASAPAIAEPSTLERRIVVMLQRHRNRAPVSRRGWLVSALVALAVGLPLAAAGVAPAEPAVVRAQTAEVRPPAVASAPAAPSAAPSTAASRRQAAGSFTGTVQDQSGAVVPGVELTLVNTLGGAPSVIHTDAGGRFAFRQLPPARYTLVGRLAGFATVNKVVPIASGTSLQTTITLQLGSLQETVTVACPGGPGLQQLAGRTIAALFPMLYAQEPPAAPVRVGGSIQPPRKLTHVSPTCPATIPAGETTVRLTGRINTDGVMTDMIPAPAEPGPETPMALVDSALDAIRQWRFSPTLLNGQPVDVNATVQVVFRR